MILSQWTHFRRSLKKIHFISLIQLLFECNLYKKVFIRRKIYNMDLICGYRIVSYMLNVHIITITVNVKAHRFFSLRFSEIFSISQTIMHVCNRTNKFCSDQYLPFWHAVHGSVITYIFSSVTHHCSTLQLL